MDATATSVSGGRIVRVTAVTGLILSLLSLLLAPPALAQVSLERRSAAGGGTLDNGGWAFFQFFPDGPNGYYASVDYYDRNNSDSGGGAVPPEAVNCDLTLSRCTVAITVPSYYSPGSDLEVAAELFGDGAVNASVAPVAFGSLDPDDPSSASVQVPVLHVWRSAIIIGSFSSDYLGTQGSVISGGGGMSRQLGVFAGGQ